MTAVTTRAPQPADCGAPSALGHAPDPLDDAGYHFSSSDHPYPYARFGGRLPPLRLPTPPHGGPLHNSVRRAVLAWSVIDLTAFVAALRFGSGPLGAVALLGLGALSWHLRATWRRRRAAARPLGERTLAPVLAAMGSSRRRRGADTLPALGRGASPTTSSKPRFLTPPIALPPPAALAALAATASVLAGLVIHLALASTGL